ncbi:hypothetical protein QLX67_14165, partial [Balneolaceae bacterium ANBcel3]|nr:hypothetical protein [Balneolaceae bacterium ANBcel3]
MKSMNVTNKSAQWTIKARLLALTISLMAATGILLIASAIYTASRGMNEVADYTLNMKMDGDV